MRVSQPPQAQLAASRDLSCHVLSCLVRSAACCRGHVAWCSVGLVSVDREVGAAALLSSWRDNGLECYLAEAQLFLRAAVCASEYEGAHRGSGAA